MQWLRNARCEVVNAGDPSGEALHPRLLFMMFDGCRHGNETNLLQPFKRGSDQKAMAKTKHQNFILYDESTLSQRRGKVRGPNALDQVEYLHLISLEPLQLRDQTRRHFPGTAYGNAIGPVSCVAHEEMWQLLGGEKKLLYGIQGRAEVGGQTPGLSKDDAKHMPRRKDTDLEPVCYHSMNKQLIEELTHSFQIKGWINCTACEGTLEEHCIEYKLPCLSVCFTEKHIELLNNRLLKRAFALMQEQESPLFEPGLTTILGKKMSTCGAAKEKSRCTRASASHAAGKAKHKMTRKAGVTAPGKAGVTALSVTAGETERRGSKASSKGKKSTKTKTSGRASKSGKDTQEQALNKLKAMQEDEESDDEEDSENEDDEEEVGDSGNDSDTTLRR